MQQTDRSTAPVPQPMTAPTLTYASPEDPPLKTLLIRSIERLTGGRRLERLYATMRGVPAGAPFWDAALDRLRITPVYDAAQLRAIPASGPVVVVANHPFGVVDGMVLSRLMAEVRPRFRLLINKVLCRDDRLDDTFLPVDFHETPSARRTNLRTVRAALSTLQAGGAVVLFPAGGIATASTWLGAAEDLAWKPLAATLVRAVEAPVVPVYFEGQNSRLFQWASRLSLTLRLALVLREVMRKVGARIPVRIGDALPPERLAAFDDRAALTAHLRDATLALSDDKR